MQNLSIYLNGTMETFIRDTGYEFKTILGMSYALSLLKMDRDRLGEVYERLALVLI